MALVALKASLKLNSEKNASRKNELQKWIHKAGKLQE